MFIKDFNCLSKNDIAIAGGKGASLGEMTQAKVPVPLGFVILASAFNEFLKETDLNVEIDAILGKIKKNTTSLIEKASVEIRDLIKDADFPQKVAVEVIKEFSRLKAPLVAVRSSATAEDSSIASWAGELESYLNITSKGLLEAVKNCWSSLFTPRAIFYRFEKKLNDQKVSVAVVIQKMIQSEISGIVFTANPVTEDKNQMIIEAGYGLGEAIVGGKVTPDTYIIAKKKNAILDKNISEQKMMIVKNQKGTKEVAVSKIKQTKQKISDKKILELAEICQCIEKHYGKSQDIEWAFEKGKFYITQSRPITTL
jgi:pyruvate,water dikinase